MAASIGFKTDGGYDESGSDYAWIELANLDGTIPAGEAFVRVPVISTGKYNAGTQATKVVRSASKKPRFYIDEDETGGFEIDVLACDADLLTFLSQTVSGKYFRAFTPYGISHYDTASGKSFQGFIFYALGKIERNGEINTPDGKKPKIKFNAMPLDTAVTITDGDLLSEVATLCKLDSTAWAAFTVTQPVGELSQPCSCKMTS